MSKKVDESKKVSHNQCELHDCPLCADDEMLVFVPMTITQSQFVKLTADDDNVYDNCSGYESAIFVSCLPEELKSGLIHDNKDNDVFSAILKACRMIENEDVFVIVPRDKSLRENLWWENLEKKKKHHRHNHPF